MKASESVFNIAQNLMANQANIANGGLALTLFNHRDAIFR